MESNLFQSNFAFVWEMLKWKVKTLISKAVIQNPCQLAHANSHLSKRFLEFEVIEEKIFSILQEYNIKMIKKVWTVWGFAFSFTISSLHRKHHGTALTAFHSTVNTQHL